MSSRLPDPQRADAATARYTAPMREVPRRKSKDGQPLPPAEPLLRVVLPLELITPIIGGGVRPLEPDREVPVRVTAIRGALRWWWRVLNPETDLELLRAQEMVLFGGVGRSPDEDATASALRVRVELASKPRLVEAGVHEMVAGKLRTLPSWKLDRRLDYALFPLQRSDQDRRAWQGGGGVGNMPTAQVIDELRFTVTLEIADPPLRPTKQGDEDAKHKAHSEHRRRRADLTQALSGLMDAIHWWLHFGGLGARTRRGFGAFQLCGAPQFVGWTGGPNLRERPAPLQPKGDAVPTSRPSLCGAKLLLGPVEGTAERAHAAAVGLLKVFRQAEGLARDEGRERYRPGRSRWPEADLVKEVVSFAARTHRIPFTHAPRKRSDHPENRKNGRALYAPRAAFGMPVILQFKDDGDKSANSQILPNPESTYAKETDRWASPVLIRPVPTEQGWRPAVLVLGGGAVPTQAWVNSNMFKKWNGLSKASQEAVFAAVRPQGAPEARLGGASEPISSLLRASPANGDAVEAFLTWLQRENGYEPAASPAPGPSAAKGGRHGR